MEFVCLFAIWVEGDVGLRQKGGPYSPGHLQVLEVLLRQTHAQDTIESAHKFEGKRERCHFSLLGHGHISVQ